MSVDPLKLHEFAGKNATITLVGEYAGTYEGKVDAASPNGMSFKPKGKGPMIVLPSDIEALEVVVPKPKTVTVKELLAVTLDNVRQHLVDRHGYKVVDINNMSPQDALNFHLSLEHAELGHNHNKAAEKAA